MQSSRLKQVRAFLNAHASREKLPGLSFAIAVNGRMMVSDSIGLADLENRVAATARSVYRLCSISKALSVVAALQLVESD
jgi:serine beta-lactamase-like protein LACTB, mitochondrial